jgi:hypothetical protein
MAKKHHMTKHQYKAYKKNHRSRKQEDDGLRESKLSGRIRQKDAGKVKNQLRHLHGNASDFLEGDEFMEEEKEYNDDHEQITI